MQNEITKNYKYLPHTNELFENLSQFVFDKESSGEVFGRLSGIMNERSKESGESEGEDGKKEEVKQKQFLYNILNSTAYTLFQMRSYSCQPSQR